MTLKYILAMNAAFSHPYLSAVARFTHVEYKTYWNCWKKITLILLLSVLGCQTIKLQQLSLSNDIVLSGSKKQIAKAKKHLNPVLNYIVKLPQPEARLFLQKAIDEYNLNTNIVYRGHFVWSRKKILRNVKRIIFRGQLYDNKRSTKVQWVRVGKMACLPKVEKNFKPILSEYFYNFLITVCGSQQHYNRIGWIGIYPTVQDLKRFFMANEQNKRVTEYIPEWKSDCREIAEAVECLLCPFHSYVKSKRKEDGKL